jgi:hypothetical protein
MPRKVFTAGEVLAAADVNEFLMDQAVQSFAGTAARGSAIPTPTTGMYTHLEDAPQRTEFWNGSAWRAPAGLTLLRQETIGSTVGSVVFNDIFSATYDSYRVIVAGQNNSNGGFLRLSLPSATIRFATWRAGLFNTAAGGDLGAASMPVGYGMGSSTLTTFASFDITNPFLEFATHISCSSFIETSNVDVHMVAGSISDATSRTSFTIAPATGTLTGGTISVYGYRKD